jgi:hypothetical protein
MFSVLSLSPGFSGSWSQSFLNFRLGAGSGFLSVLHLAINEKSCFPFGEHDFFKVL